MNRPAFKLYSLFICPAGAIWLYQDGATLAVMHAFYITNLLFLRVLCFSQFPSSCYGSNTLGLYLDCGSSCFALKVDGVVVHSRSLLNSAVTTCSKRLRRFWLMFWGRLGLGRMGLIYSLVVKPSSNVCGNIKKQMNSYVSWNNSGCYISIISLWHI